MHPTSRLARVQQQLRVFADLHASELSAFTAELEAAGLTELATRLKTYKDLHAQESRLVLEELADLRAELEPEPSDSAPMDAPVADASVAAMVDTVPDPAAASPKRARWLAEQIRRAEPTPISRRQFLTRGKDPS